MKIRELDPTQYSGRETKATMVVYAYDCVRKSHNVAVPRQKFIVGLDEGAGQFSHTRLVIYSGFVAVCLLSVRHPSTC